jgi:hypothetical protein
VAQCGPAVPGPGPGEVGPFGPVDNVDRRLASPEMLTIDAPMLITDPFRDQRDAEHAARREDELACEPCTDEGPTVLCVDHAELIIELL